MTDALGNLKHRPSENLGGVSLCVTGKNILEVSPPWESGGNEAQNKGVSPAECGPA